MKKHTSYRADMTLILILSLITVFVAVYKCGIDSIPSIEATEAIEVEAQIIEPVIVTETTAKSNIERTSLGEFRVTAYCLCSYCCGEWADGITYTGTIATENHTIAVDPSVIPLGSTVEINGIEYVAEDIGGAIDGNRADIFFNSHEDALEWGVRYCETYILEEVKQ